MPTKRSSPGKKQTLDIAELAQSLDLPLAEGTVTLQRGAYYLATGRQKLKVPLEVINKTSSISSVLGYPVPVIISGGAVIAIGIPSRPHCYILCYYPRPDLVQRIRPELRAHLLDLFVREKVITPVQRQLLQ